MSPLKQDSATFNMSCLLREWDRAPRERRRQLLQDFIDQHWNRSAPELELELAQMASLFLARICVWIKLTYMSGTCLTEQLQELCVLPNAKEIDKFWALRVLSCVANGGTCYKETICECYGIRAVAECMAKSHSERTQEAARDVLEQLAEGNPRFRDRVYKGLIGVLPCYSAKAQQLALQSIRLLQTGNPVANRALIDRITCIMESLHFSVQAAALELIRTLMSCDIADDIMKALVGLLHPQREIELGKLFTEAVKPFSDNISSGSNSDEENNIKEDTASRLGTEASSRLDKAQDNEEATTESTSTTATEGDQLMVARPTKSIRTHHLEGKSTVSVSQRSSASTGFYKTVSNRATAPRRRHRGRGEHDTILRRKKLENKKVEPLDMEDQTILLPTPTFVQQASAAKCIAVLIEDSTELTQRLLRFGALSGLLYAMGNLEYPDSQRQASLAVKMLCVKYLPIRSVVAQLMGQALYEEFFNKTEQFYVHMTPLQADLLVSSKTKFSEIDEINLDDDT